MENPTAMHGNAFKKLPNMENNKCFGCGSANPIGLRMEFYTDERSVVTSVKVPELMCGWLNMMHGGILATILDEIMSWTAIYMLKVFIVTKNISIDYLKPVYVDDELHAVGVVLEKNGDKEVIVQGEIFNSNNVLCARGRAVFAIIALESMKKLGKMNDTDIATFIDFLQRNF